ncbi:nucleotidyltransferase family protein, partial [bacterium]|nr:nucleotidyltransferase family protein [candidate division CSSED10-310 bacterium]
MTNPLRNSCWPTPEQRLLLHAVLLKGQDAISAWEQWAAKLNFDKLDYGSQRLIPLLYRNLLDHGIQHTLMARYKGVYRRFWLSNQFLFNHIKSVLSSLNEAGIKTLLFKGAGLVVGYHLNYALRPMDDIDFLVHKEAAQTAIDVIKDLDWFPLYGSDKDFNPMKKAVMYRNRNGQTLDLHWHSLNCDLTGKHDGGYWERSFSAQIDEVPVRVMGFTDQLIHTCVHGIWWNEIPPMRWIVDSIILLENSGAVIQWDFLMEHSKQLRVTLPMYHGLRYLKNELNAPVPEDVV